MKNKLFFGTIVCAALAIGVVLTGCDNGNNPGGTGTGGGGGIPAELVGRWYRDLNNNGTIDSGLDSYDEGSSFMYEFKSDGTLSFSGQSFTVSVSGDKITASILTSSYTATFKIDGNKLTLSDTDMMSFVFYPGTYLKK
jgi:hypothetical protein